MTKAFAVDLLLTDNIETCRCGRFFVGMVSKLDGQRPEDRRTVTIYYYQSNHFKTSSKEWIESRIEKKIE